VGPLGIKVTVLEPGGMQTDWAGSSMRIPPISEPYQPTVGAMARVHEELGGAGSLGDPDKVAQVVLKVAALAEPPPTATSPSRPTATTPPPRSATRSVRRVVLKMAEPKHRAGVCERSGSALLTVSGVSESNGTSRKHAGWAASVQVRRLRHIRRPGLSGLIRP